MLRLIFVLFAMVLFSQDISEDLDPFNKVKIKVAANTEIVFGNEYKIEIFGREKELKNIRYEIYGKSLIIEDKKRSFFNWNYNEKHRLKIKITTKSLIAASINGSGDARIAPLKNEQFDLEINGSADVEMSGVAKDLSISLAGSGDLDFSDMEAKLLSISIRGSGDIEADGYASETEIDIKGSGDVNAKGLEVDMLDATIYGSGDIFIQVNKEIRGAIYGSGDIRYRGKGRIIKEKSYGSGDIERD